MFYKPPPNGCTLTDDERRRYRWQAANWHWGASPQDVVRELNRLDGMCPTLRRNDPPAPRPADPGTSSLTVADPPGVYTSLPSQLAQEGEKFVKVYFGPWNDLATRLRDLPGSDGPAAVRLVLHTIMGHVAFADGRVTKTSAAIATETGIAQSAVSKSLSVLVRLGVIRRAKPSPDQPGRVVYFVNPRLFWNGDHAGRVKALAAWEAATSPDQSAAA